MKQTKIKALALAGVMAFGLAATTTAQAHPRWILPSHFTVSKEGGDWLTFDVTASHGTFVFDKPAGSENAHVIMPDATTVVVAAIARHCGAAIAVVEKRGRRDRRSGGVSGEGASEWMSAAIEATATSTCGRLAFNAAATVATSTSRAQLQC